MHGLTVLLIAVALAMDSFSVSICGGMGLTQKRVRGAVRMAAFFAAFQAGMPILGWLGGIGLKGIITVVDHWIAFGLLTAIGGKMLVESATADPSGERIDPANTRTLLALSVATSIDALATGTSFAFTQSSIMVPVIAIGIVTFGLSILGALAGHQWGHRLQSRSTTLGGIILIAIGAKILVEHLFLA